jgi:hypothetical protein
MAPAQLAMGLKDLIPNDVSIDAQASLIVIAETILLLRGTLKGLQKKR